MYIDQPQITEDLEEEIRHNTDGSVICGRHLCIYFAIYFMYRVNKLIYNTIPCDTPVMSRLKENLLSPLFITCVVVVFVRGFFIHFLTVDPTPTCF